MSLHKCKLGELITQRREKNNDDSLPISGVSKDGLIPPKQQEADTSLYNMFYRGDFIFNPARMELNSIAYNDKYDKAICSSLYEVFYVHRTDLILPEFLALIVKQDWFTRYCEFLGQGSAREYCRFANISEIEIEFPDIDVQKKTVHCYNVIKRRIELKQRINDNLEATGLAIFKEISKAKPTESVLSDYCDFQEGYVNPPQEFPQYFDGRIKWLRGVDFSSQIIINTSRTLTDEGFNSAGKSALLFEPNTIVITKSGTIGKLGIIADYMCGNRATINIKPKRSDLLPFVYFFLKAIQPQFYDMAVGSAQVNLYVSVLQQIACPKYDDSFEKFTKQATVLLDEILKNSKEITYLSELQGVVLGELSR